VSRGLGLLGYIIRIVIQKQRDVRRQKTDRKISLRAPEHWSGLAAPDLSVGRTK
jgi:hypothetical protein